MIFLHLKSQLFKMLGSDHLIFMGEEDVFGSGLFFIRDMILSSCVFFFFFFFFFIQFNVPFKIISLIETSQSIGGRNGSTPEKPPDTPASSVFLFAYLQRVQ